MRPRLTCLYLIEVTSHQRKIAALVSALLEWYPKNARDLPWRRTTDPYRVFVSEIMLQQTQVKTVLPYWERWMRALPTLADLAAAEPETIHKLWEGLGYYSRVRNLQRAARIIQESQGGVFPQRYEALLELPGIGPYTAGAICSIAFNQPTPILDGNVIRVLTRLFAMGGNPRSQQTNARLWVRAEELVRCASRVPASQNSTAGQGRLGHEPDTAAVSARPCSVFNQALMELGALVCSPRQPRCAECPVAAICVARKRGAIERFPESGPKVKTTARRFVAFIVERGGRFLVCQRPAGVVNAHLWEFPNIELDAAGHDLDWAAKALLGIASAGLEPFGVVKHSITRYRIQLEVFRLTANQPVATLPPGGRWVRKSQLESLPFPGAHRKIRTAALTPISMAGGRGG